MRQKADIHAQKITDHCWAISEELRAYPSTQIIDQGHLKTAKCFEDEYVTLFLMVDSNYSQKKEQVIRQQFSDMRKIYKVIYNDVTDIQNPVSSGYTTNIVNTEQSYLMQNILADLIYNIHHGHKYGDGKPAKAIKYLDNFTP